MEVIKIAVKKDKKEKLAVIPKKKTDALVQRPYELWSDMDRLFDRFRTNIDELFREPRTSLLMMPEYQMPRTDIVDLGDKYEMHVEMPGIKKEDICIEMTPTNIEISAEHEEKSEDKGKNWLRQERSSMGFYRSFQVPENVKAGKVEADLKNGVLTLMLPKVEPKPKFETTKIKIK